MRGLLIGLAAVPFFYGAAIAAQPEALSDAQMDKVTAGEVFLFTLSETQITNSGTVMVNIDPVPCSACFVNIQNEAFTLQAQFGPAAGSNSFHFLSNGF